MKLNQQLLIERIEIEAFKSISSADIDLRPLTVVTGQNSAGKSSLLQSIRLSAHIASLRGVEGNVQLNSPELRLGDFGDVLHRGAGSEVRLNLYISGDRPAGKWGYSLGPRSKGVGAELRAVELSTKAQHLIVNRTDSSFASDLDILARRTYEFGGARDVLRRMGFDAPGESTTASARVSARFDASIRPHAPSESEFSSRARYRVFALAELAGGLPNELLEARPYSGPLAQSFVEEHRGRLPALSGEDLATSDELSFDFEQDLPFFLVERLGDLAELEVDRTQERPWIDALPGPSAQEWWAEQERNVRRALQQLVEESKIPQIEVLTEFESDDVDDATDFVRSLPQQIHFLGPLRSDPASSQPAGYSTAGLAMLGTRGELAIPYLYEYEDDVVSCPMPGTNEIEELPLLRAVSVWLEALGIAERQEIQPVSQSLEYRLIDPQTKEKRDLTSVGVGASQILPVLILCLAARPGELILLEQPELHLHPKPQQILGDFFLGIARSGRQLMVETHSEYLINRLRLRFAERPDDITALTSILYAERTAGATDFVALEPNDFGGFDDWPDGFFDQLPAESEKIVRAAAERRRERSRAKES